MRHRASLRIVAAGLGFAAAVAGCATMPPSAVSAAPEPSRLEVTNLAGHAWRIVVRRGETAVHAVTIERFGVAELRLEQGDYVIEQTLLDPAATMRATRQFPVRFEAAQSYRWSLATLLSGSATRAAETENTTRE